MNRQAAAVVAALTVALVAGCGAPSVTHGTITGKHYQAASEHTELRPIYSTDCSQTCHLKVTSWYPETVTDPECYQLSLAQDNKHGSVCVSPAEYERAQVGGQW